MVSTHYGCHHGLLIIGGERGPNALLSQRWKCTLLMVQRKGAQLFSLTSPLFRSCSSSRWACAWWLSRHYTYLRPQSVRLTHPAVDVFSRPASLAPAQYPSAGLDIRWLQLSVICWFFCGIGMPGMKHRFLTWFAVGCSCQLCWHLHQLATAPRSR